MLPSLTSKMTTGFTFPENIGDLGPDIIFLNLSVCNISEVSVFNVSTQFSAISDHEAVIW